MRVNPLPPKPALDELSIGPIGHWTNRPLDQSAIGPIGHWTNRPLDQSALDEWALDESGSDELSRTGCKCNMKRTHIVLTYMKVFEE